MATSAVIDRVLAALNAGDLEAFVACYAADATIEDGDDTVLARGQAQIRARYAPMLERSPMLNVELLDRWELDPYVVQEERVTGRSPDPERHIAVYRIMDGRIARERLLR